MRSAESLLIFGQLHAGADIPLRPVGTTRDSLVAAMVLQRALMEGEAVSQPELPAARLAIYGALLAANRSADWSGTHSNSRTLTDAARA